VPGFENDSDLFEIWDNKLIGSACIPE
jgi:hypothetical protein